MAQPRNRAGRALLAACAWMCGATPLAAQSAFQVKDVNPIAASDPHALACVNGALFEPSTLYFAADDGTNGVELWKSDGTDVGTQMVANIRSGSSASNPARLTRVQGSFISAGRLFFTADDGINGMELWKSDGTGPGTVMVKNINGNPASSSPDNLTNVPSGGLGPGRLFFTADDGTSGIELWVSDGTPAGTVRVKDINPAGSSSPMELTAVGTVLYFSADNGVDGRELWKSDGTDPGTVRVKDIYVGPSGSNASYLTDVNGTLFFVAFTPALGAELWKSNGTDPGTVLVKDIRTGVGLSSIPQHLVALGSTLLFQADDGANGREVWKSDGTGPGTVQVAEINPTGDAFISNGFTGVTVVSAGVLYFVANDGVTGDELWRTDGTAPGTARVKDIYPGPTEGSVVWLTDVNGTVFFSARNAPLNSELWRSDGRPGGTYQIQDIVPGADTIADNLTACGPFLFFSAYGSQGNELWATDLVAKDGFESGGLGVWSSANTDGGDLSVQPGAALHGALGLAANVDDTASLFVVDESPDNELHYRARFRLDPNGFDPGEANGKLRVRVFIAFEEDPALRLVTLVLRRVAGQYALMGRVRLDDGTRAQTGFFNITDQPHMVELDWRWSEGASANSGSFELWIDEVPVSNLTGLDNSASLIDFVRLGAMTVKPGASGTLYFDDFESRRERYIGYLP
jgi:ELWxxDGT repeat protein